MKILIGSCTQHDDKQFEESALYHSVLKGSKREKYNNNILYEGTYDAIVKTSNKDNICKHYNKVIELAVEENYDCVILVHDDVSIEDSMIVEKLRQAFKKFDVVGLAGAKQAKLKQPVLWHLMSSQQDWSGAVAHTTNTGDVFMTSFGPTPARCLIMDGLFLAIKVSSVTDDIRFDENIPTIAHHYDIDFCLNANRHRLKLTTWPIWAVHKSPGLTDTTDEFKRGERYLLDKWKI